MSACCAIPSLRDRLILLDGWSKTYAMTGWRMGYAVWPAELASCHAAGHQLPFLRQRRRAICRDRGARGPAGRRRQDGARLRRAAAL
jgi:hypothetical protein